MTDGPFAPMSSGWFATQFLRLALGAVAGIAAAHWERPGKWWAPGVLAFVYIGAAASSPPNISLAIVVPWLLTDGAAVIAGAFLYTRKLERNDA